MASSRHADCESRIIAVSHHSDRLDIAESFGATATVLGGSEGVDDEPKRVRDLTTCGVAPVREYAQDHLAEGYRATNERAAVEVLVEP